MSNYNVDTLENKIVVEAQEAIKSLQEIIGYVNQSKTAINSMKNATGLKSLDSQAKKTTSSLTKLQLVGKGLKNALNISGLIYGFKNIYGFLKSSAEKSIDYIETLNLFEVSMGKTLDQYGNLDNASSKYYTKALKFQNDLNEKFGTNIEETMRYQALYNQMAESMGINDNASYIISENLTKLGIDLASLFNRTEEDTMEALRAGVLAGQTKPLRNYGLDVTQQTLAPLASELGIERSVKQLSQAEKMILRYIAVLRQASNAHGDFARTIESPANQLKVFRQQFTELKTAIGNLFQGLLGQILPYVNAVLMVIKELIKALAGLFGFEVSSSNSNLADTSGIEDLETGVSGVNTGLGSAVDKAKELKAQLMGFDEINNITTDTDTGSGGVGGGGGGISSTGIDSKLLDAMKEYDNLMEKVKMKATDIRDKIMDWLGFTKVINPLTGEVSWKLREGDTNLKKILKVIKAIIGLAIAVKVIKLIGNLTKLWNVLKNSKTATTSFGLGIQTLKKGFTGLTTWVKLGIEQFGLYRKAGDSVTTALGKTAKGMSSLIPTALKVTAGIAGLGTSLYGAYDAMRDYSNGTKSAGEATGQLALSIGGATASGALLGSTVLPGIGTAIGALIGFIGSGISAILGLDSSLKELQKEAFESAMFENYGIKITELEDKIIDFTKTVLAQYDGITEYSTAFEENKGKIETISGTLSGYIEEIQKTDKVTEETINNMKETFSSLVSNVKNAFENNINIVIQSYLSGIGEAGDGTEEFTDLTLDDLLLIKNNGNETITSLENKFYDLLGTYEKYGDANGEIVNQLADIQEQLDLFGGTATSAKDEFSKYVDNLNTINFVDWSTFKSTAAELSEGYETAMNTIDEAGQSTLDSIDRVIAQVPSMTKFSDSEKEEIINNLEGYRESVQEGIKIDKQAIQTEFDTGLSFIESAMNKKLTETAENTEATFGQAFRGNWKKSWYTILTDTETVVADTNAVIKEDLMNDETVKDVSNTISGFREQLNLDMEQTGTTSIRSLKRGINVMQHLPKEGLDEVYASMNLTEFEQQALTDFLNAGGNISMGLAEGIRSTTGMSQEASNELAEKIKEPLSTLEPSTKDIMNNMFNSFFNIFERETPGAENLASELSDKVLNQLDKDPEMKKVAVDGVKAYLQGLSENKQRKLLQQSGIENVEEVMKGLKKGDLSEDVGVNIIKGIQRGLQNNYWQGNTFTTASNFASNILNRFKRTFGIQSPSKKTKQYGLYLLEGLSIGINNGQNAVLKEVSNFSDNLLKDLAVPIDFIKNGVSIDKNKLVVDTNQFVDYGTINGNINSNLTLNSSLSQIPNLVYSAVIEGMKNSNIQVDIEAKTEDGVIVKKVSQGFKDYVTQTGELPFPVPV